MQFKNSAHKRRFMGAIKPMDQKDKTQMAVAFLLTATKALWDRSRICMMNNKILVHRIHLNHTSEEVYALYCAAKDIAFGTTLISVSDLVDEELLSRELYRLKVTVDSKVKVEYGVYKNVTGVVKQVLRCDKHYPPHNGCIDTILGIVELKEEKPRF